SHSITSGSNRSGWMGKPVFDHSVLRMGDDGCQACSDDAGATLFVTLGCNNKFKKRRDTMSAKHKTTITAEPGRQELFITREFDAPRELVFKAHTDPDLYVRWMGPRDLTTTLETFEPVSGGRWRFIQKDKDGNEFGFHGV